MARNARIMRASKGASAQLAHLRSPVSIQASAEEGSDGLAKFAATPAYSGGRVPGYTLSPPLKHDYVIDLSGMAISRNVVANLDHKPAQRVGHSTDISNDGEKLSVAGVLSAATSYRDEVANSSKGGFQWEVSIEASVSAIRQVAAGKSVVVNGQTFTGPIFVVGKSKLTGLGFVSQGADEGNNVLIAASAAGEKQMSEFDKFVVSLGADPESITDEQRASLQSLFDNSKSQATATASASTGRRSFAALAEEERIENKRVQEIHTLGKAAMQDHPIYIDQIENAVEEAIKSKLSVENFELQLLRELRAPGVRFQSAMSSEVPEDVTAAAICLSAGLPNIEKHFQPKTLELVDRHKMRGFGLQQLLLHTAMRNGYTARAGERIYSGNIRDVLEYCFPPRTARMSGFSTISLPNILGNVANKELLEGFSEEGMEWKEIAQVKSVTNFFQVTSYRMNDSLEYEEVGPGGEIKHGSLSEESYTRQVKTYAKMLGLTRNDIINDNLGAFDDLRTRLGRGASKKLNTVFWTKFLDNASFFTSGRGNYISGSTTNLGVDGVGLQAAVLAFRKLRSADNKRISGAPSLLVVPPELEWIARQHYTSTNVNTGGSATATSVPNNNVFAGLYRPVVVDFLSDTSFTGYSTTAFYLLRDPRFLASVVVSFLNGQQNPTIESTNADFDTLGINFRGYHDFGCDQAEYLAGVKSKGAA